MNKFIYFDLGNVLVNFTVERLLTQVADVAGIAPEQVQQAVFDTPLHYEHECGRVDGRGFYEEFCRLTSTRADYDALVRAASEIFELNASMLPVVTQLVQAGWRIGILSNTCAIHWDYCLKHYRVIAEGFKTHVLSFEVGACKPDAEIFLHAAKLAGVEPEDIFYTDDLPQHIAGARHVGFDAVQYTSTRQLVAELHKRGVQFNY